MTQENRWTIDELLARYDLEPELQDIFVEGAFDREILTHHLIDKGSEYVFYEIDSVEVPSCILSKYGLTLGNKQRVIALSQELSHAPPNAQVFCIVDRDLDHWFESLENSSRLRWSSFCSIEGHFITTETIRDIMTITSRAKISDFQAFTLSLSTVLRQLFALRLADRELGLKINWVAIRRYLSKNSSDIQLDIPKYIQAILNNSAATDKKSDFTEVFNNWQKKLDCDIRLASRGHDYTNILAWAISEFNGQKEFATTAAIERLFVLLARSVASISLEVQ